MLIKMSRFEKCEISRFYNLELLLLFEVTTVIKKSYQSYSGVEWVPFQREDRRIQRTWNTPYTSRDPAPKIRVLLLYSLILKSWNR